MTGRSAIHARLPLACALVLASIYGVVIDASFVADDFSHLARTTGDGAWTSLRRSLADSWYGVSPPYHYRPAAVLSFVIEGRLFGLAAWPRHLVNVALFLFAALLLASIVRALLVARGRDAGEASIAGGCAALLFCAFPAQIEAVAWWSHRGGPIAMVACLLTARLAMHPARSWRRWSVAPFAVALTAKESAVTALAAVAVVCLLAARPDVGWWRRASLVARTLAPHAALVIVYLVFRDLRFGSPRFGGQDLGALLTSAEGLGYAAGNTIRWLGVGLLPVGDALLGGAAPVAKGITALAFAAPFALAGARSIAALLAFVPVALLLLGPSALIQVDAADLSNGRFLPLVALPLCAALGVAWSAAWRRPIARPLFGVVLITHVAIGAIHACAWRLAADDLLRFREQIAVAVGDLDGDEGAPSAAPFVLTFPPEDGPAGFALKNTYYWITRPPFLLPRAVVVPFTSDRVALARSIPAIRAEMERDWRIFPEVDAGPPLPPWLRLADRLRRWPRLLRGPPAPIRSDHATETLPLAATLAPDGRVELPGPIAAFDVAMLRLADRHDVAHATIDAVGSRGALSVSVPFVGSGRYLPLEQEPDWLFGVGELRELRVRAGGIDIDRVDLMPALPTIDARIEVGSDEVTLAFRPPFPSDALRLRVVLRPDLIVEHRFHAGEAPRDDQQRRVLRFRDGMAGARRPSSIDWRRAAAITQGAPVVAFLESLYERDGVSFASARSAPLTLRLMP